MRSGVAFLFVLAMVSCRDDDLLTINYRTCQVAIVDQAKCLQSVEIRQSTIRQRIDVGSLSTASGRYDLCSMLDSLISPSGKDVHVIFSVGNTCDDENPA